MSLITGIYCQCFSALLQKECIRNKTCTFWLACNLIFKCSFATFCAQANFNMLMCINLIDYICIRCVLELISPLSVCIRLSVFIVSVENIVSIVHILLYCFFLSYFRQHNVLISAFNMHFSLCSHNLWYPIRNLVRFEKLWL